MKRPTGWKPNPQAMATVSLRRGFTGDARLSIDVDTDTWLTPRAVLSQLGTFDLDPCAAAANPLWVCQNFYTAEEDGLSQPWIGRVFMNPPFSNTAPWLRRHAQHGNGISLVPASLESRVWRETVWALAKAILLLYGRLRFCNPDGSMTTGRPLRSIALIAWSDRDVEMLLASSLIGVMLRSWDIAPVLKSGSAVGTTLGQLDAEVEHRLETEPGFPEELQQRMERARAGR